MIHSNQNLVILVLDGSTIRPYDVAILNDSPTSFSCETKFSDYHFTHASTNPNKLNSDNLLIICTKTRNFALIIVNTKKKNETKRDRRQNEKNCEELLKKICQKHTHTNAF